MKLIEHPFFIGVVADGILKYRFTRLGVLLNLDLVEAIERWRAKDRQRSGATQPFLYVTPDQEIILLDRLLAEGEELSVGDRDIIGYVKKRIWIWQHKLGTSGNDQTPKHSLNQFRTFVGFYEGAHFQMMLDEHTMEYGRAPVGIYDREHKKWVTVNMIEQERSREGEGAIHILSSKAPHIRAREPRYVKVWKYEREYHIEELT